MRMTLRSSQLEHLDQGKIVQKLESLCCFGKTGCLKHSNLSDALLKIFACGIPSLI